MCACACVESRVFRVCSRRAESGVDNPGLRTPRVVSVRVMVRVAVLVRVAAVPVGVTIIRVVAPPAAVAAVAAVSVAVRLLPVVTPVRVVIPEHSTANSGGGTFLTIGH